MRLIDADETKKLEHMVTLKPSERALFRLMLDRIPTYEPPNPPLTLEELRGMDGEPAYLDFYGEYGEWVLVDIFGDAEDGEDGIYLTHRNGISAPFVWAFQSGGKIYRRKPEGGGNP